MLCILSAPKPNEAKKSNKEGNGDYRVFNLFACIALVLRNIVCLSILAFYSFTGTMNIPEKIEAEALNKVEDALTNEDSLNYFIKYLRKNNRPEGIIFIEINELITEYEELAKQDTDNPNIIRQRGEEIWKKIKQHTTNSELFNKTIIEGVEENLSSESELDSHLFDQIFGVVINELQNLYEGFRKSRHYASLAKKQEVMSIIVTRMQKVNLV